MNKIKPKIIFDTDIGDDIDDAFAFVFIFVLFGEANVQADLPKRLCTTAYHFVFSYAGHNTSFPPIITS